MSDSRRKVSMNNFDSEPLGLWSLASMNSLRLEAMELFDRSLAEHKSYPLEGFIERQLAQEQPPLDLLSQVAEDVHQRLMTLRQNHFEVRDDVLKTLRVDFKVDLSPLVPPNTLENYHLLSLEDALCYLHLQNSGLSDDDRLVLKKMLQTSLDRATQLYHDVMMAEHLYDYLSDWLMGLHVLSVRDSWASTDGDRGLVH